jgi:hypothetical protein
MILGAVLIGLGGGSGTEGFLVAPLDNTYDADLSLKTDAGTASVTLVASPNPAGVVFSQTSVSLTTSPTIVKVHSTVQSSSRGDTTIQVLQGTTVVASLAVTSIKHPVVHFKGRFESRFATQPAFYNQNPMYTATNESVGPGWTWALEGEPGFVPASGNVPENLETPGMGRNIRLNNPVALRSHAAPVVSTVSAISGSTTSGTETFTTGDPLIGQPVNFGADTYFAGNRNINSAEPRPEEYFTDAAEPLGLFELHLGTMFGGASAVGPFTHKATFQDEITRTPDSRPIATGLASSAAERTEFGLPSLAAFSETRIDLLVADYNNPAITPPGPSAQRRNLARRIGRLLSVVSAAKSAAIQAANPGAFTPLGGTLGAGWTSKEVFNGKVDADLQFQPGTSSVMAYLQEFTSFDVNWVPFAFHSDELCAHHKGSLTADINFHGSYTGDPHTRTVNGISYDMQSVGEFTLLRGGDHFEVQVRQTPVAAANPITDSYSGLTSCVSLITAVAARVGRHRVALQPGAKGELELFVDGKRSELSTSGIDLDNHHVTAFDASGEMGLRIDYQDGTVVTATPAFWSTHSVWYINVDVSNTKADEGIMGYLPKSSWLPRLRNGENLGPMPASLQDRYTALYKKFADSWRVSDRTSLFVYERGKSTKTFTDVQWPAEKVPCTSSPGLQIAGQAVLKGMPVADARRACKGIVTPYLQKFCVFDVATTGDEALAKGYRVAQEVRLYGTAVQIVAHEAPTAADRSWSADEKPSDRAVVVTAKVVPLASGRPKPTGTVTLFVDGVPMNRPVTLDERGYARISVDRLKPGEHKISATYSGGGKYDYHSSTSPAVRVTIGKAQPR